MLNLLKEVTIVSQQSLGDPLTASLNSTIIFFPETYEAQIWSNLFANYPHQIFAYS